MNPSIKAEIARRDGDLRITLLLGIANWFLFLDHIPHNVVSSLTLRNFGFSGATDLFVFVGGYAAAIMYGKIIVERGFVVGATRIFRRLWQLYAAYVVMFDLCRPDRLCRDPDCGARDHRRVQRHRLH